MAWQPPDPVVRDLAPAWQPPDAPVRDLSGPMTPESYAAGLAAQEQEAQQRAAGLTFSDAGKLAADVGKGVLRNLPFVETLRNADWPQIGADVRDTVLYPPGVAPTERLRGAEERMASRAEDLVIELAPLLGGAKIAQLFGRSAAEALKYAGRGMHTRAGAERAIGAAVNAGGKLVPEGAARTTSVFKELWKPAIAASTVGGVVDYLDPTPYELTDKPVAGAVAVGSGAMMGREGLLNAMLGDPKFRDRVMRASPGGLSGAAIGALAGWLVAKGLEFSKENFDKAIDAFFGSDDGEAAAPVDPAILAQRLRGN